MAGAQSSGDRDGVCQPLQEVPLSEVAAGACGRDLWTQGTGQGSADPEPELQLPEPRGTDPEGPHWSARWQVGKLRSDSPLCCLWKAQPLSAPLHPKVWSACPGLCRSAGKTGSQVQPRPAWGGTVARLGGLVPPRPSLSFMQPAVSEGLHWPTSPLPPGSTSANRRADLQPPRTPGVEPGAISQAASVLGASPRLLCPHLGVSAGLSAGIVPRCWGPSCLPQSFLPLLWTSLLGAGSRLGCHSVLVDLHVRLLFWSPELCGPGATSVWHMRAGVTLFSPPSQGTEHWPGTQACSCLPGPSPPCHQPS